MSQPDIVMDEIDAYQKLQASITAKTSNLNQFREPLSIADNPPKSPGPIWVAGLKG